MKVGSLFATEFQHPLLRIIFSIFGVTVAQKINFKKIKHQLCGKYNLSDFFIPFFILCRFSQCVVTYGSTYVLVALSIDRYDAITHPMNFTGSCKYIQYCQTNL